MEKHLLLKHGILKQFSIRKAISAQKLSQVCKKIAATCNTTSEFENKVRDIVERIDLRSIPGTIPLSDGEKKNNFLNVITNNILNYIASQKLPEEDVMMVLNALAYTIEKKDLPYFEFYNEDGTPAMNDSDEDESDDDKEF